MTDDASVVNDPGDAVGSIQVLSIGILLELSTERSNLAIDKIPGLEDIVRRGIQRVLQHLIHGGLVHAGLSGQLLTAGGDILTLVVAIKLHIESGIQIVDAIQEGQKVHLGHILRAVAAFQMARHPESEGAQIGVGDFPDIVGGVLGGVQLHGVALLLNVIVDGGAGLLVKGAAVEVIRGDDGGEVELLVAPQGVILACSHFALVCTGGAIHSAGHMGNGEVGDIDGGGGEIKGHVFGPVLTGNAGVGSIRGNLAGSRLVSELDGNCYHQLLGRIMLLTSSGILANIIGSVIKAGNLNRLFIGGKGNIILISIRSRRPGRLIVGGKAGASIALCRDAILIRASRQIKVLGNHIAKNSLRAQLQGRAAGSLADLLKYTVQAVRITGREVVAVTVLGSAILHRLCIFIVAGGIMHVAVGGHKLYGGTLSVLCPRIVGKVRINIAVRVSALKNAYSVYGSLICALADLRTGNCVIAPHIIDIIRTVPSRVSIRKQDHDTAPLLTISGIRTENRIGHIQAFSGDSIALCFQSAHCIFYRGQALTRVHFNKAICFLSCSVCEAHNRNTMLHIVIGAIPSISALRLCGNGFRKIVDCGL